MFTREQFMTIGCQELLYFSSLYCLKDSVDSTLDPKKTPAPYLLPNIKSIWWTWGQWELQCPQPSLSPTRYKILCKHICCFFIPIAPVRSSPKPCKLWHYRTCPKLYPTSGISYRIHRLLGSIIEGYLNRKYNHYIAQSQQLPD